MKISGLSLYTLHIPLRTPFKTALRTVEAIDDIVVKLTADTGEVGYGEAPPTAVITGDTLPSIAEAITAFIAPKLIGVDVEALEEAEARIEGAMVHNTSAKAAVSMALYDLWAKRWGAPLYKLLGGAKRELQTDITISVNAPQEMERDAAEALRRGFSILKVKLGSDVDLDLERLRAVRRAAPKAALRVDANQGWTARQAVRIIGRIEDAGLMPEVIEQPVPAHDLEGLAFVTRQSSTPILADESVFSPGDALRLFTLHAADMINIKLMKAGGIGPALRLAQLAQTFGVACMMGCMLEGNIAVSAAAHLALAKGVITMVDLDGPALCRFNPVQGGAQFASGRVTVVDGPGLGVTEVEGLVPYRP